MRRRKTDSAGATKSYAIDYERELNPAQLEAVEVVDGPALIIAGAGSGKTRTLVYRVARLVEEGVNPEQVLLLSFTRKAAHEMLARAAHILDERCGNVSGGTFHSFANMVLRSYAGLIGHERNFTILDRGDSEEVINQVRKGLGLHKTEPPFPRKKALLTIISKAVNKNYSLEDAVAEEYPQFIDVVDSIQKIQKEYTRYKKTRSIMDYDDLLIYLKVLLEEHDDVRTRLSRFYQYIMVDEYQDTNKLQADIACLLASEHENIMVVGDDAQSIYSFRGAHFRNIMDFPALFPNARLITLDQNYRSRQPILDLTNRIIQEAREKYSKTLFTSNQGGQRPFFIRVRSENYQSKFVVRCVVELQEQGIPLNEIAVLFRAGWHSNDLEVELAGYNIPFVKYGGFKFVETAHVKDIIAHLKITANLRDSVSWRRVLQLIEGIGPKAAQEITDEVIESQKGLSFLKDKRFSRRKYGIDLSRLCSALETLGSQKMTTEEQIKLVLDYYRPLLEHTYDDFNKRLGDLGSLVKIAKRYDSLEQFLVDMTLEPLEANRPDAASSSQNQERLVLSTIHSAKGLEWHTVFILYVVDGYLPSSYAFDDPEDLEEERRLFYVAATRAKENLYLMKPEIDFTGRQYYDYSYAGYGMVSRFLNQYDILDRYVDS